jgi:hypothetical protein
MTTLIDRFNATLQRVSLEPGADTVRYVDRRAARCPTPSPTISNSGPTSSHPTGGNPIEPGRNGFLLVAQRFAAILAHHP